MHKTFRKIVLSMISIVIVLITMVATTYAWVGMLSYSTIGGFDINLQTENKNSNYSLFISATGDYFVDEDNNVTTDSFSEQLTNKDLISIKKQILINMGKYSEEYLSTDESINSAFNKLSLYSASPNVKNDKVDLSTFIAPDFHTNTFAYSKDYYKFDLYLSVDSSNGEITGDTTYLIDLYIANIAESLIGQTSVGSIINGFEYKENYLDGITLPPGFKKLGNITPDTVIKSNSSFASRLAIEYYEGIPIKNTYSESHKPLGQYVYQGGTQIPMYDEKNSLYSFGGVLEEENNIAINECNALSNIDLVEQYNRFSIEEELVDFNKIVEARQNDLLLVEANNSICADTNKLKLGIINGERYKVKVTLYFWYEGWDADNMMLINKNNTSISLTFASNFKDY